MLLIYFCVLKVKVILYLSDNLYITSQNTMYCGGEPEHKHVANKCTCEEIQYVHITIMNARVMNVQA